jgi:hypothetical protein
MSATRLHKLTAVSFAVLYGVVGFTGETLHYLLTDPALLWSGSQSAESGVYYHTHGPDYHGHFHRHTHDGHHHHSHAAGVAERRAAQSPDEVSLTTAESGHQPHACPLVTLVSTLKLSQAGCAPAAIMLDALIAPSHERDDVWAHEVALDAYPRGPPARCMA